MRGVYRDGDHDARMRRQSDANSEGDLHDRQISKYPDFNRGSRDDLGRAHSPPRNGEPHNDHACIMWQRSAGNWELYKGHIVT